MSFFSKLFIYFILGFPGGSVVKTPPASARERVYSLSQEDSLEKEMATHSSILAWEIPRTEEPGRLQSRGLQESDTSEQLTHKTHRFKLLGSN